MKLKELSRLRKRKLKEQLKIARQNLRYGFLCRMKNFPNIKFNSLRKLVNSRGAVCKLIVAKESC